MNVQNLDVYAGEDRTLTLFARDDANKPKNLTGQTIAWRVGRPPFRPDQTSAVFEYVGTILNAAAGSYTVEVEAGDTWGLSGNYVHMGVTADSGILTFVNNTGDALHFVNNQGTELVFVNQDAGNIAVVTAGTLRIRAGLQT